MLKKFLLILLLMFFCICFAAEIPKNKQAQYKTEIETYINKEIPEMQHRVFLEYKKAERLHNHYLIHEYIMEKSKYADKLDEYINNINGEELYFYLHLIDITDKYVKIKNDMPPTDSTGALYEFISPYLKSAKVSDEKILDFSTYTVEKANKILEYINEI